MPEDTEDIIEDNSLDDDYSNSNNVTDESVGDKPTMDKLFDTKELLIPFEKSLKGESERDGKWVKTSHEQARNKFIDKTMNFIRVIINPSNLHTYIGEQEAEKLLLEANEEFIKQALDEPTVSESDLGTIINSYDFAIQTFSGQFIKGHGSVVLRDIYAGLSQGNVDKKKDGEGVLDKLGKLYRGE